MERKDHKNKAKKITQILWTNRSLRENKDGKKETDLRHIKINERKEPRPNKSFIVKGGNASRRKRNYDCEAFGKREEESEGRPKSVALKPGFRSAIAMKLNLFHRELGLYYLLESKYTGELLLFKNQWYDYFLVIQH